MGYKTCEIASHFKRLESTVHKLDKSSQKTFTSDLSEHLSVLLIETVEPIPGKPMKRVLEERETFWQGALKASKLFGGINKRMNKRDPQALAYCRLPTPAILVVSSLSVSDFLRVQFLFLCIPMLMILYILLIILFDCNFILMILDNLIKDLYISLYFKPNIFQAVKMKISTMHQQ